jgi:hypothetical protein
MIIFTPCMAAVRRAEATAATFAATAYAVRAAIYRSDNSRECSNSLNESRILLYEFGHTTENLLTDLV